MNIWSVTFLQMKTLHRGGFSSCFAVGRNRYRLVGLFRQFLGISHLRIKETFFAGSAIVTSNPLSGNPVTVSYPLALTVTLAFRPPSRLRVLPRRHCTFIIPPKLALYDVVDVRRFFVQMFQ